jgi:PAS domain S-box-containing protein
MPGLFPLRNWLGATLASSPRQEEKHPYLHAYRVLCSLACVLVPSFGIVYWASVPNIVDPLWARLSVSALFGGLVVCSFASERVRRHLGALMRATLYVTIVWIVAVAVLNDFTPNYVVGLIFVVMANGIAFSVGLKRRGRLARFFAFVVALSTAAVLWAPRPQVAPAVFVSCVLGTALVVYVGLHLHVQTRERLVATDKRFRAALAGSFDAFLLFDRRDDGQGRPADFALTDLNAHAEELLGGSRADLLGTTLRELLPLYREQARFETLRTVARTGEPLSGDVASASGTPAWMHQQVVRTPEGIALTLRDITERKESELETARLKNFYEQIVEAVPSLAVFDREKRFVYLNADAVSDPELRAWLIGKTDLDYCRRRGINPEMGRRRMEHIERVLQTGETVRFEENAPDPDGALRHRVGEVSPITDLEGRITQVAGYVMDVTERRRAEEKLRASERRYRTLMDAANDAIFVADAETGLLVDANRRAQELTGRSREELSGMHQSKLHPPEKRAAYRKVFAERVRKKTAFDEDLYLFTAEGEHVPVAVSASVVEVEDRRLVLAIFRDVTARRRHEQQLVEAREHAEEILRLKTDILNNMSHELRTPLTGILGFSEALASDLSGESREFAGIIHDSAQRLQNTLESVLDMAQLEHGEMALETHPVTLSDEVEEVLPGLRPLAEEKDLALRVHLQDREAWARLDETAIHRVIQNLAGNAIKFTEEGHVALSVDADAEQVYLHVEDTGVGISEDFLPHLFDQFQQQSRGLGRRFEGSGLGLAITERLVGLMDGAIEVESTEGEGTTFTVPFPRVRVARSSTNGRGMRR